MEWIYVGTCYVLTVTVMSQNRHDSRQLGEAECRDLFSSKKKAKVKQRRHRIKVQEIKQGFRQVALETGTGNKNALQMQKTFWHRTSGSGLVCTLLRRGSIAQEEENLTSSIPGSYRESVLEQDTEPLGMAASGISV